ncbi:MAG: methyltransferase domain-containing protein [Clostridiales bacterium]|nr:methyltransferase domain-containing protein [Clostridiales bacterium]
MDREYIDSLDIKNLRIIRKKGEFTYGADAVALAKFANIGEGEAVLDIGTGTGIIPLMLCGMSGSGKIIALEIQEEMYELAVRNVALNSLEERITPILGDIRNYGTLFERASFSLVVSNPPYYKVGSGKISPNRQRAVSKFEVCCTLEDVVRAGEYLLNDKGRLCVVIPYGRLEELKGLASRYNMYVSRAAALRYSSNASLSLALVEIVKEKCTAVYSEICTFNE